MKNYRLLYIKLIIAITVIIGIFSCANPVAPTGGPKDEAAPVITEQYPENLCVNFNEKEIEIVFNEYIQLKDLNKQLLISPPFEEKPDITTRGKSVLIKFNELPDSATTYVINMGNAVVDFTEGNQFKNFQYIFSTGNVIDSLEYAGDVVEMYTGQPHADVYVMLYKDLADSVPMKDRPTYLTRTDENGFFRFSNLAGGAYKLFALMDGNSNFIFDLPKEMIAYSDSAVHPYYVDHSHHHHHGHDHSDSTGIDSLDMSQVIDTLPVNQHVHDSTHIHTEDHHDHAIDSLSAFHHDTITTDSIHDSLTEHKEEKKLGSRLWFFQEVDTTQKIIEKSTYLNRRISFIFKNPVDSLDITVLDTTINSGWKTEQWNTGRDSLNLWLPDYNGDSLKLVLNDGIELCDTIAFSFMQLKFNEYDSTLKINSNMKSKLDLYKKLEFIFDHPVKEQRDSLYYFVADTDTSFIAVRKIDELGFRYGADYKWEEDKGYQIAFPDSAFMDIYGQYNDSIKFSFRAKKAEDYTTIKLICETEYDSIPQIIHLLDSEGQTLTRKTLDENNEVVFEHIAPGTYNVKVIIDLNRNGKWDTGNYLDKKQPEPVIFFNKALEGRGNWELEENWKIEKIE